MSDSKIELGLGSLLLRRLYSLVSSGMAIDEAAARMRGALSEPMRERLDALVARLKSPGERPRTGHEMIIHHARDNKLDPLACSVRFSKLVDELEAVRQRMLDDVSARVSLFISTAVVAILITLTVNLWVVPSFSAMYSGLGSRLPLLTRLIFEAGGGAGAWLLIAFLVVTVWAVVQLRRDIQAALTNLVPLPARWRLVPVFRRLSERLNHFLTIVIAESLRGGGMAIADALAAGARSVGAQLPQSISVDELRSSPDLVAMVVARDCGDLENEFSWQVQNLPDLMRADFELLMQRLVTVATTLLGVVVGLLVISLYLPIFQMGSITG